MTLHVAVLMGGLSVEREVSLRSGAACAKALEEQGFVVTPIDVDRDVAEVLARLKPQVAFNALHGRFGEDGIVQGVLEMLRIPYTHSGVLASALAMQKDRAKDVMRAAGIPVPEGITCNRHEAANRHVLAPPYVVKPVNEGSSVGVIIVNEDRSHPPQELTREDWPHGEMPPTEGGTITTQSTQKADRSTSFRQILNKIFTIRSNSGRLRRIEPSAAAV
jgi:D-alanine-D-alanine ligase